MRRIGRRVLGGLDVLLIAVLVLAYAARYVHPRTGWWLDLIALALPYLSVVLVVATVLVVLMRRWRLAALHGVLLVLVLVRFGAPGRLAPAAEADDDPLTVLTLNVPRRWGEEEGVAARIVGLVADRAPEIVAMQEATAVYLSNGDLRNARSEIQMIVDSLGYAHGHLGRAAQLQQPVLATVPVLEQELIALRRPEWRSATQVVRSRFRWQGREAVLYNVHLHSFGDRKPWVDTPLRDLLRPATWRPYLRQYRAAYADRAWEADTIRAMIDRETLPTLVVGDFNSTMHSWAYAELAEGYQDAFKVAGVGWGATYHRRFPLVRIDFVLASPEWQILGADVPTVDVSDHRPLVAQLQWRDDLAPETTE